MKKNKIRCIITGFICVIAILGFSITTYASGYEAKTVRHSCGSINTSYGYKHNYRGHSIGVKAGEYCPFCDSTVPEGDYHTYMYNEDLYYFRCDRCNVTYTRLYKKPIFAHYTNGVQDYYNYN
ncbi:MAG: hypothetical protein ACI4D0_10675 [Lachnospira sp.]